MGGGLGPQGFTTPKDNPRTSPHHPPMDPSDGDLYVGLSSAIPLGTCCGAVRGPSPLELQRELLRLVLQGPTFPVGLIMLLILCVMCCLLLWMKIARSGDALDGGAIFPGPPHPRFSRGSGGFYPAPPCLRGRSPPRRCCLSALSS